MFGLQGLSDLFLIGGAVVVNGSGFGTKRVCNMY